MALTIVTQTPGLKGKTLPEVKEYLQEVQAALLARVSGVSSVSRGGTSTGFGHLKQAELEDLERKAMSALYELDPVNYPAPAMGRSVRVIQ